MHKMIRRNIFPFNKLQVTYLHLLYLDIYVFIFFFFWVGISLHYKLFDCGVR